MPTLNSEIASAVEIQERCLQNANGWLNAADAILGSTCEPDTVRRASVLYAHAIQEIGKAVSVFRRDLYGYHPVISAHGDELHYLESAREVLDESLLSITSAQRGVDDLFARLESFATGLVWFSAEEVDHQRLTEAVWVTQGRVSDALRVGLQAILLSSLDEFAPVASTTNPIVMIAARIDLRHRVAQLGKRRRGPDPLVFNPAWLEWLENHRPVFEAYLKHKRFVRLWMHGDLPSSERAAAAKHELVDALFRDRTEQDRKSIAAALVRRGRRPSDIINILIARRLNTSEALVRRATRLLNRARQAQLD